MLDEAAPLAVKAAVVVGKVAKAAVKGGKVVAKGGKKAAKGAKGAIGAWVAGYGKSNVKESLKDELLSNARKKHKKAKSFKQWRRDSEQKPLKRGEVRVLDKKTGKWKSNKPD
tara:strand:+ start:316 stop:654 length:339 start_codon:yes stop_codon:yes gene_type:complete